eukprot:CAMPEP_0194480348 /NCGR_PEP_ID=MMETSP0253-20130528/3175_1 /TAXON_ID=2966 /ORGANISM="Noctiluca scintillans" /LENGTH=409 /DNA_ID=CAMNT_0039319717 /DNA_START=48 /DNA_END=1277 /DNA_ORIENTATION=+
MASRTYDIVLNGCTGFTGNLVAEYFAKEISVKRPGLKWALCGRSQEKVEQVKANLRAQWPAVNPAVLVAASEDQASMDAVVAQTRVLLTTVGPYLARGSPAVDACARFGTHYVDITGEAPWVADMLDRYNHVAQASGALIVPMSGYDSIPSDLGVLFAVRAVRERFGQATRRCLTVAEMGGALSGGTFATGIEMARDFPEHYKMQDDPFCMGGGTVPRAEDEDQFDARLDEDLQVWTSPFMMSQINTRVVRRSNALLHYGSGFSYGEAGRAKDEKVAEKAAKSTQAQRATPDMWKVLDRLRLEGKMPKQGEGPSAEVRAKSWFKHNIVATAADGRKLLVQVRGGDPGYGETAKMISESALCLLEDHEHMPRGGILTSAAAGGELLIKRLQAVGIDFEVLGELPGARSRL